MSKKVGLTLVRSPKRELEALTTQDDIQRHNDPISYARLGAEFGYQCRAKNMSLAATLEALERMIRDSDG